MPFYPGVVPISEPRQIITPLILEGLGGRFKIRCWEGVMIRGGLGLGNQVAASTRGVIIWLGVENRHNTF